jgi:hypothetical protein
METLTESGRLQVERNKEKNKKARHDARKAARAEQRGSGINQSATSGELRDLPPVIPPKSMMTSSSTSALLSTTPNSKPPPIRPTLQTVFPIYCEQPSSRRKGSTQPAVLPAPLPTLPAGQSALTPVASRVREQDADAIAHFMDAFRNAATTTTPKSAVVDPGRPVLKPLTTSGNTSSNTGLTGARAAIHRLKQSVSLNQLRGVASPSSSHSSSASVQIDMQDFESEHAVTPKASTIHSPLHMHTSSEHSITPPATRRSPFALLSRTASHQD